MGGEGKVSTSKCLVCVFGILKIWRKRIYLTLEIEPFLVLSKSIKFFHRNLRTMELS